MAVDTQSLKRVIFLSSLGNALEFYDFTLCGVFIPLISKIFFPNVTPTIALFASFFAFGAGYLARPFGAYVFGFIGDRLGRKKALTLTVGLIGLPTILIGLLPGYALIGIAAPIILVLCRLLQGLCTGGEYNGSAVFAMEHGGAEKASIISGAITGSAVLGALLASLMGYIALRPGMPEWAWRVPFIVGGCISFVAYFVRRTLQETDIFLASQKEKHNQQPLVEIWKDRRFAFFMNIFYAYVTGVLFYTIFGFLNIYMVRYLHHDLTQSVFLNTFGLLSFMLSCFGFGVLNAKLSLPRMIYVPIFLVFILIFPAFYALHAQSFEGILMGQILFGLIVGCFLAPGHVFMLSLFPPHERYTGTALSFSIGMAIAGSTTPSLLTLCIDLTHNTYIPAFYAVTMNLLLIAVLRCFYTPSRMYRSLPYQESKCTS